MNIGDKVKCINHEDTNHLKFGEVYTVKSVEYGGTHLILSGFEYSGSESTYSVNRFELVEGEHKCHTAT